MQAFQRALLCAEHCRKLMPTDAFIVCPAACQGHQCSGGGQAEDPQGAQSVPCQSLSCWEAQCCSQSQQGQLMGWFAGAASRFSRRWRHWEASAVKAAHRNWQQLSPAANVVGEVQASSHIGPLGSAKKYTPMQLGSPVVCNCITFTLAQPLWVCFHALHHPPAARLGP